MFYQSHGCLPKQKWITTEPETLFSCRCRAMLQEILTLKVTISTYH